MLITKYQTLIDEENIICSLKRLTNQIYKLLPLREENADWNLALSTINEELAGLYSLFKEPNQEIFILLCKLEGLFELKEESDFFLYRRSIFDCLQLISKIIESMKE